MEEYVEDDLADDSDDERRIEKTERAAERKITKIKCNRCLSPKVLTRSAEQDSSRTF